MNLKKKITFDNFKHNMTIVWYKIIKTTNGTKKYYKYKMIA